MPATVLNIKQKQGRIQGRSAITPAMRSTWCAARRWPRALQPWPDKPVLHDDNGATLKAITVLAMLNWLGVKPSYSGPRVGDDNAYAESLFRTARYRPEFPAMGSPTWRRRVMRCAPRPAAEPGTLVWKHKELDAHRRCDTQL